MTEQPRTAAPTISASSDRDRRERSSMPSVTVHYDGGVQLPERVRRSLGLDTGDRLEAELVEDGLILRVANTARREAAAEAVSAEALGGSAPADEAAGTSDQEDAFGSA